ncbi:hypothetical protein PN465_08160 [Nodularia spumigena CS-584]|uniref:Uncharacterized protein n=1 Tax=Nodularia spumigena UHCC 0060 TaxID=3110300 RepID=A0ABU5UXD9_NODSP|nr:MULTISPECIES: hypothetical protein [Cyanophyceae]MDB9357897.1 hypothetical protein [Nodularia spumigena CS-587/03]MDB9305465.1 hypothetical protein [Nodularia spumigena CS-591/12]MDB9319439.1 hypothetical protein [Nodularia spumigena CS-590/01A]MDB9324357.1 hypothetical protein [Nodularia spumigena CS-591/07A]MDB9325188.1 hypothetical protein [Nodularia spumigena CS-590/02]
MAIWKEARATDITNCLCDLSVVQFYVATANFICHSEQKQGFDNCRKVARITYFRIS